MIEPVLKWSGSKRKFAGFISELIPDHGTYFEPFLGGGSVLGTLGPRRSHGSDIVMELIGIWKLVKKDPDQLLKSYKKDWKSLQRDGHIHFYKVRERFNNSRRPEDLFFLSRTCVNGLIRFNSHGDFNNSLHHTRPGIHPDRLEKVLKAWSSKVQKTSFACVDYREMLDRAVKGDIVYMDPPYMGNKGRYQKIDFDFESFWDELHQLNKRGIMWLLSLDGSSGSKNYTKDFDQIFELSKNQYLLRGESSAFPRLLKKRNDKVQESLFTNFKSKA